MGQLRKEHPLERERHLYDVIVVGGGPAGMTAALYAGRARRRVLLLEKSVLGGMATYTGEIANYPGFPEPLDGPTLMGRFEQQFRSFGVDVKRTAAKEIKVEGALKVVSCFRFEVAAPVLILATGNRPRLTGAPGEERFLHDRGISFCATCDAPRYQGKRVMVVGSGDAAIEEALFLTRYAREVLVSVRRPEGCMRAHRGACERAMVSPVIRFCWNTVVHSFEGEGHLERVVLADTLTGEQQPHGVDCCFLFIGYQPETSLVRGLVETDGGGYIRTDERMETSAAGIFCAGDCRVKEVRQVATAVGDGAVAGVMADRHIDEVGDGALGAVTAAAAEAEAVVTAAAPVGVGK